MRGARNWYARQWWRLLSVLYYEFLFELYPGRFGGLATRVHQWEAQQGKGDVPIPQAAWERQYQTGHWNRLRTVGELGRFSLIVGYIHELKPQGAVWARRDVAVGACPKPPPC
jgi:hypothetical protein